LEVVKKSFFKKYPAAKVATGDRLLLTDGDENLLILNGLMRTFRSALAYHRIMWRFIT
jgi:hypothetical protein